MQIMQCRQIRLQPRQMPQIGDVPGTRGCVGRHAFDLDHPCISAQQTRQDAQQRGLAGTIAALHQQGFIGIDGKRQWPEHQNVITRERKRAHGKQR